MYDILKAICQAEDWVFTYARKDFQNLFDGEEEETTEDLSEKVHVFLDPVIIEDLFGDENQVEGKIYSGDFMLVYSSDLDEEGYEQRYEEYIKPLLQETSKTIKDSIRCDYEVSFKLWRSIEVINAFDYNFDGLIISYNIEIEE